MKKVEVYPAGFKVYDDNDNLIGYEGNHCGEGFIYKNEDAFKNNPDEICYISEHSFDDIEGDYMTVEDAEKEGETHKTIVEQVMDAWGEEYMLTDEQAEYFAEDVFGLAEWACIDTYLAENFSIDDCIEFDDIKEGGIFTRFQKEAVKNGMTPAEYADRSLSYEELIEFESEFDNAFVVDDDCADDESELGLGTNARITYVDERRTGSVENPKEFAEIHGVKEQWKKF